MMRNVKLNPGDQHFLNLSMTDEQRTIAIKLLLEVRKHYPEGDLSTKHTAEGYLQLPPLPTVGFNIPVAKKRNPKFLEISYKTILDFTVWCCRKDEEFPDEFERVIKKYENKLIIQKGTHRMLRVSIYSPENISDAIELIKHSHLIYQGGKYAHLWKEDTPNTSVIPSVLPVISTLKSKPNKQEREIAYNKLKSLKKKCIIEGKTNQKRLVEVYDVIRDTAIRQYVIAKSIAIGEVICACCKKDVFEECQDWNMAISTVEGHHLEGIADGIRQTELEDDIVPICLDCHGKIHRLHISFFDLKKHFESIRK